MCMAGELRARDPSRTTISASANVCDRLDHDYLFKKKYTYDERARHS